METIKNTKKETLVIITEAAALKKIISMAVNDAIKGKISIQKSKTNNSNG